MEWVESETAIEKNKNNLEKNIKKKKKMETILNWFVECHNRVEIGVEEWIDENQTTHSFIYMCKFRLHFFFLLIWLGWSTL